MADTTTKQPDTIDQTDLLKTQPGSGVELGPVIAKAYKESISQPQGPSGGPAAPPQAESPALQQARYQANQYAAQGQPQQPPAQTTAQAVQQSGVLQPQTPQQPQPEETSASGSPTPPSAQLQPSPEQAQSQDITAADLQGGGANTISAQDLGGDGTSEGTVNRTVQDYKTIQGITDAYAQNHITKDVAQGAIGQLQNQYNSASPEQQQAMEQAEAEAKKADQPKAEPKPETTPAFETLSSLLESGVPGITLRNFPMWEAQHYLDDQHKAGAITDQEYADRTDLLNKAKYQLQNNPALTASIGLGATQQGQEGILDAEKQAAGLIDKAVPGFLTLRPQQAATEVVLAKDNFLNDYQKLLASGPRPGGDPTAPGLSAFKVNPVQTGARLDQAQKNYQDEVGRLAPNQDQQNQVDAELARRGLLPNSPEFQAAHNMAPKPGASTGGPELAALAGMTAASLWNPLEGGAVGGAIDRGLGWLLEKGAIPFSAGGRALSEAGVQTIKQTGEKVVGGLKLGTTIALTDILRNPNEFLQNLQDPKRRVQTIEALAAELGVPMLGGAVIGSGLLGLGKTAEIWAGIMRSASPAVRLGMEVGGERALSTELPYRAGRGPVNQVLGRGLESYLKGAVTGVPFAAPSLAQGDVKQFVNDVNQFGLYGALLRAPKTVSDAIRGSNFDYLFSYRGEDPATTKAPPQTRYGDSYYERATGNYVDLDDFTAKAMKTLDPSRQATFTHAQDMIRPYADAHMLPDGIYEHIANDQGADPDTRGFVARDPNTGRLQAFFKASEFDPAALHEMVGHVGYKLMGPQNQAGFNHLLSQVVDMDGLANTYANRFKAGNYTMADLPDQAEVNPNSPQYDPNKAQWSKEHGNLTKQGAYEEAGAETLQALYSGKSAEAWTKKPSLLRQFAYYIGAGAEGMGLPTTTPDVNGPLGVRKSVAAAKMLDAYLQDLMMGNIPQSGATKNYFPQGPPFKGQQVPPIQPINQPTGPVSLGGGRTPPPPAGGAPVPPAPGPGPGGGGTGFAAAKPANVVAVRGPGGQPLPAQPGLPPAAPGAAPETGPEQAGVLPTGATPSAVDESVIRGLMKQGFSREQAQDFAARGTVSPLHGAPRAQPVEEGQVKQPEVQVKPTQPQVATRPQKPPEQWDLNETIERGRIADQLSQQTGKHVDLNDPRVNQIYTEGAQEPTEAQHDEIEKLTEGGMPAGEAKRQVMGAPVKRLGQPEAAPMPLSKTANPTNTRTLRATWFGRNPDGSVDTTDEGRMSMYDAHHGAWGADLLDKNLVGVALSTDFLRANGIDPRKSPASQGFKVRVTAPNGKTELVDIVDIGPRNKVDMTYGLGKKLGLSDNSHLDLQLVDKQGNTVALKDTPSGPGAGEGTAYMPAGGGGGGAAPQGWTPYRGPAPTYPWSPSSGGGGQAPAAPGEEAARAPAGGYPSPADTEPENVPVTQAPAFYPRGAETEGPSAAMQQAQYFGTGGGGYGMGPMYAGIGGAPEAPSYMPSGRRKAAPQEEESTLGEPMPKGIEDVLPHLNQGVQGLKTAQALHAKLLSKDDTRVRQQGTGSSTRFKGEHFVPGDPVHAAALADVPHNEKVALAAGQTAITNRKPMHMVYESAPPSRETPISRQSRSTDYEESSPEARLLGSTKGQIAGHSVIPLSVGISLPRKKGDPNRGYIEGISTSAAAHNHYLINEALQMMGEPSPYPEMRSPKFRNDLRGYVQNLLAGHRGTGEGHQVGTEEFPAKPDPNYVPYRLKQKEADFMNAILNNQRARTSPGVRELARKGGTLLSEEGEVNPLRQRIDQAEIEDPHLKYAANERWSKDILEPTIRTFKAGLIKSLHKNPEEMPADLRQNVQAYEKLTGTLSKEMGSKKGWPDIPTAAAFMPGKKPPKPLSPEEHEELAGNIRKQWLAGKLRTPEYMERMREVPEPGEDLGPAFMPMAGRKARGFAQAEKEGRTFETPLPGGGKRFEIDDRDMEFKPPARKTGSVGRNALEERYMTDKRGPGIMPLSDAIRHPELFENYPHLRNTKISTDPTIPHYGHYQAPYLDEEGNMRGDHLVLKDPTDKETLAHELQHAVQFHEKFAGQGTNSDYLAQQIKKDVGVRQELRKQWDAAYPERKDMDELQLINNDSDRAGWMGRRVNEMAHAMYDMDPGEIEARVAGQRAIRLTLQQREEAQAEVPGWETAGGPGEAQLRDTTPKEDVLEEMRQAAHRGRIAGTVSQLEPEPKAAGTFFQPAYMAAKKGAKAKAPPVEEQGPLEKPEDWDKQPEYVRQAYLERKVADTLANAYKGPETHELKVQRNDEGGIKYDPAGNPVYEKHDYNIVNSPLLKKKTLSNIATERANEHKDIIDPEQHKYLKPIERRRLSALRNASAVKTMGDKIFDSYMKIKDKPAIMAGEGWYSRMREKLSKALGEHHELFAQLLGATSAKTPVRANFIQALDALEQYRNGAFDKHRKLYKEAYDKLQEGGKDALVAHMKATGVPLFKLDKYGNRTELEDHKTAAGAMANWITHHEIMPKQKNGQKYNANSQAVLKALARTWLSEVKAPKTPNFAGNLTGRTLEATIDVWAARHIQRLGYEGHGKGPWRALAQAEPGVNRLDFAFSQDAMRHAADKISAETGKKMNPDDLQAILWFAEKHHYEDKGWTRGAGAAKSSFDNVADLAFPTTGEPMTSDDLREHFGKIDLAHKALEYENHANPKMREKFEPYLKEHGIEHHHLEAARAEAAEPEEEGGEEED